MIAIILTVGVVMKKSVDNNGGLIYVYDQYQGNNSDPQVAYDSKLPVDSINNIVKDQDGSQVENN